MKITYARDDQRKARCWFAKISPRDRDLIQHSLESAILEISEHSTQNNLVWQTAETTDRKFWGQGRYFGHYCANTMLSVLAGSIKKLRSGGDLTEKQVVTVNKLFAVIEEMQAQQLLRTQIPCYELQEGEIRPRQNNSDLFVYEQ